MADEKTQTIEPSEISAHRRSNKAAGGKIATGNRLRDGVVIYLAASGEWTPNVDAARVETTPEGEAALKAALDTAVKGNLLIDAAVIDTVPSDIKPARLREQIRAVGPTVRPDLARRASW
jgi:hypothetical protein